MSKHKGMSSHSLPNVGASVEWHSPPEIIEALGPFDDDPCQHGATDGLTRPWKGFVYLNPPYDRDLAKWLGKLADHGNGIALIFARTETKAFFDCVWGRAEAVMFLKGRLHFYRDGVRAKGNSGAPSCLVAYGEEAKYRLFYSRLEGALAMGWEQCP